jgi:hypothetical protein
MSRSQLWREVAAGGATAARGDASAKLVLGRGCDPVMAQQSTTFLPPLLNGAKIVAFSDDDSFFAHLDAIKAGSAPRPSVVFFAPGACRWSAARLPIPGGNAASAGWGLEQYHARVREVLGGDVPIVGSDREAEMVPLLRRALGLKG